MEAQQLMDALKNGLDQMQKRGDKTIDSELTPCNRNTSSHAALRVFAIFTFTVCSPWFVMTRNRSACCS